MINEYHNNRKTKNSSDDNSSSKNDIGIPIHKISVTLCPSAPGPFFSSPTAAAATQEVKLKRIFRPGSLVVERSTVDCWRFYKGFRWFLRGVLRGGYGL